MEKMVTYSLPNVTDVGNIDRSSLTDYFQRAGSKRGLSVLYADFFPFKEFKTVWTKRGGALELKVTDYMAGARQDILEEFADCICRRIICKRSDEIYTPVMKEWLQSQEFVELNRSTYLQRSRNLAYTAKGIHYDLEEARTRLLSEGLLPDIPDNYITWTKRPNLQRMGYCSVIMRVVAVSSALDSGEVPEFVSDYVLYHELLHLNDGLKALGSHHDAAFRTKERKYPRWKEAEVALRRIASGRI
ncbi:MAG: M48 family metallopeptidase [Methanomassiliicoccales archaeon]|nr:MAG: M48 family metallopeptidase [Methanomassiliicoccales archaeon]